jgi:hypothetical protein
MKKNIAGICLSTPGHPAYFYNYSSEFSFPSRSKSHHTVGSLDGRYTTDVEAELR